MAPCCGSKRHLMMRVAILLLVPVATGFGLSSSWSNPRNNVASQTRFPNYHHSGLSSTLSTEPIENEKDEANQENGIPTMPQSQPERTKLLQDFSSGLEQLSKLRPNQVEADISLPLNIISRGQGSSSYTRLWTAATWQQHSEPRPHERYWKHLMKWRHSATASRILPTIGITVAWSTFMVILWTVSLAWSSSSQSKTSMAVMQPLTQILSSATPAAISSLSAPLALLLTLRANQSMSRLLEARLAWGRLLLQTQGLANMARVYLWPVAPQATLLLARHLALLGWMLKARVRGEEETDPTVNRQVLSTLLSSCDLEWVLQQPRATNALLARIRQITSTILLQSTTTTTTTSISSTQLPQMQTASMLWLFEEKIQVLEQVLGTCNRLVTSPIPPTYSRHLSRVLSIWLLAFPLSLLAKTTTLTTTSLTALVARLMGTVLATSVAAYVLVGIDEVGMEIENAFRILPLQQMAASAQGMVAQQFLCVKTTDNDDEQKWNANEMPTVPLP